MRNGSAAFVPLFIGILLLFWAIMFMGGATENFMKVKDVSNLQNIQKKIVISAMKKRYQLVKQNPNLYGETGSKKVALDNKMNELVHTMMLKNGIDN